MRSLNAVIGVVIRVSCWILYLFLLVKCLLFGCQITVHLDKSVNPFGNLIPFQQHIGTVAFLELYSLCIVAFRTPAFTRHAGHLSSYSIFVFQKFQLFIGAMRFWKESVNSTIYTRNGDISRQYRIDFILRDKTINFRQRNLAFRQFTLFNRQISEPGQNRIRHEKTHPHQIRLMFDHIRKHFYLPNQLMQSIRLFHLFKEPIHAVREHNRFCCLY